MTRQQIHDILVAFDVWMLERMRYDLEAFLNQGDEEARQEFIEYYLHRHDTSELE